MDDLRRRFANLDRTPAPDLWDTIERRASALEPVERVTAVVSPLPLRSRRSSRGSLVLLAATVALLAALVAGALTIGSRQPLLPAIVPVPSASASASASVEASITPAPSGLASDGPTPWIVFRANRTGVSYVNFLWAMRADGSGAHEIADTSNVGPVAWSRDGTRLLILKRAAPDAGRVLVAEVGEDIGPFVDTGVEEPSAEQWEAFDFAPDNERAVYVRKSKCQKGSSSGVVLAAFIAETPGANCHVLRILDLRSRQLLDLDETLVKDQTGDQNLALELPAWSPDGTRIAYTRLDESLDKRELWVINADGTNPSRVELAADVSVQEPRWSPDGTRISFTSETYPSAGASESAVYVVDVATGRLERVTIESDPAAHQLCCAEWFGDTRLRVEGRSPGDTHRFWLVALDATPHEAQVLADLTESLAAIGPQHLVSMRGAPGDPGRTFYWQPAREPQP